MRSGRAFISFQEKAVVREYEQALRLGAIGRAYRIFTANTDLQSEFVKAERELALERATQLEDIKAHDAVDQAESVFVER